MNTHPRSILLAAFISLLCVQQSTAQDYNWRTIEFETTEVTAADVALSPDGHRLIFTMLGHLFRLPVEGGTAEQLTFGPYYDTDPVFSPDGTQVAFVSDRDGSEGNVFVLDLATRHITQITHEPWAGRPTWAPDGQAIVYLRFVREAARLGEPSRRARLWPAMVRRVALNGGEPETLSAPLRTFRSVFYLPDGRLAWSVIERETGSERATTRIEVMSAEGTASTLRTVKGYADRVVIDPMGEGLYYRRILLPYHFTTEALLFVPLPAGAERVVIPLANPTDWAPRFAVAADGKSLYVDDAGRLWKIALPSGAREPIAFNARVKLEVDNPVAPRKPYFIPAGISAPARMVLDPRLSPDGRFLVFGAAGHLWQQSLDGGPAQRLFQGSAFERDPAFSPDGRQLAFVFSEHGREREEVRVFNFESGQTRTLASGLSYWNLSWDPDGQRLVFVARQDPEHRVVVVNISTGKEETLTEAAWWWGGRPHFSADGQWLYFTGSPFPGTLYRFRVKEKGKPEEMTRLERQLTRALVSPDGNWIAFRRNTEIWVAPLGEGPVKDEDVRQFSPEGGDTFAFTPDGSGLLYSVGNRVWRHPLTGGKREEIPIRLELQRPTPPPVLLRRVRVLNFSPQAGPPQADAASGFGPETSLFIEQGRIRWIGSERGRTIPRDTVTLDVKGRFAIPGLFDLHVHTGGGLGNPGEAFLAYGVTSVRDVGDWSAWLNALADRGETTSDPVPRYFFSGELLFGSPVRVSLFFALNDEEDARAHVRRLKKRGVHFIKVHPPISWPLQRAVAEEARRQGLPVVGHGQTVEEITKSVTLGYATLEHSVGRVYQDVLQMLAHVGTRWVPTSTIVGGVALLLRDQPERLADAKLRAFTPECRLRWARTGGFLKGVDTKLLRGFWVQTLAGIRAAHRRGVKLQVGTDPEPMSHYCFYGSMVHWELEFFVQAGLPPLEVLRIATQEAAAAVGAEDDLGTLEAGKLADLVLLDRNPLEDIRNTQSIWRVIKGGWMFDPEEMRPDHN